MIDNSSIKSTFPNKKDIEEMVSFSGGNVKIL